MVLFRAGTEALQLTRAMSRVYPSGAEVTTEAAATTPEAPGLLTTVIGCGRWGLALLASERAARSVVEPAAKGQISWIGFLGKSLLLAASAGSATRVRNRENTVNSIKMLRMGGSFFRRVTTLYIRSPGDMPGLAAPENRFSESISNHIEDAKIAQVY
jgi:hypothetical protein